MGAKKTASAIARTYLPGNSPEKNEKAQTRMTPKLSMFAYKPDEKSVNNALWGNDQGYNQNQDSK